MNPEQVVAVLALLADLRLSVDALTQENEKLRSALADMQRTPPA